MTKQKQKMAPFVMYCILTGSNDFDHHSFFFFFCFIYLFIFFFFAFIYLFSILCFFLLLFLLISKIYKRIKNNTSRHGNNANFSFQCVLLATPQLSLSTNSISLSLPEELLHFLLLSLSLPRFSLLNKC